MGEGAEEYGQNGIVRYAWSVVAISIIAVHAALSWDQDRLYRYVEHFNCCSL